MKEEEKKENLNYEIKILNVDENIIQKYHYDNENKKEKFV